MLPLRCRCGKILAELADEGPDAVVLPEALPEGPPNVASRAIVVKCRHCKRFMVLWITGLETVDFVDHRHQVGRPGRSAPAASVR